MKTQRQSSILVDWKYGWVFLSMILLSLMMIAAEAQGIDESGGVVGSGESQFGDTTPSPAPSNVLNSLRRGRALGRTINFPPDPVWNFPPTPSVVWPNDINSSNTKSNSSAAGAAGGVSAGVGAGVFGIVMYCIRKRRREQAEAKQRNGEENGTAALVAHGTPSPPVAVIEIASSNNGPAGKKDVSPPYIASSGPTAVAPTMTYGTGIHNTAAPVPVNYSNTAAPAPVNYSNTPAPVPVNY